MSIHAKSIDVVSIFLFTRFLFGDSAPLFALIGICLASGTGILTKDDELEGVCWEIRVSTRAIFRTKLQIKRMFRWFSGSRITSS